MSGPVQWEQLAAIVGIIVTAGGIVAGVVLWIWSRLSKMDKDHARDITALAKAHADFRVEVAKDHPSNGELTKVESRIEGAIKAMADQFERGFDRIIEMIRSIPHSGDPRL